MKFMNSPPSAVAFNGIARVAQETAIAKSKANTDEVKSNADDPGGGMSYNLA